MRFRSIALPTDDWMHNSDSWLARRRYVALAVDCGSSNPKSRKVNMRLNTEEEISQVHSEWHDTIVTRDP
jgi:hypothetical protein